MRRLLKTFRSNDMMRISTGMNHSSSGYSSGRENPFPKAEQMDRIEEFVHVAKDVLGEGNIQTIILFGSKSTETDDIWSDYDFYVVTREEFGWDEKFEIYKRLEFPVDIILRTHSEMEEGIRFFVL